MAKEELSHEFKVIYSIDNPNSVIYVFENMITNKQTRILFFDSYEAPKLLNGDIITGDSFDSLQANYLCMELR